MSHWSFAEPYRLLDARIGCGIQFVLGDESAIQRLLPSIPEIKEVIESHSSVNDYSLELSAVSVRESIHSIVRFALMVRFAFMEDCDISSLSEPVSSIKKDLAAWLKNHKIVYQDLDNDMSVLPYYPVWYADSHVKTYIGSLQKESEKIYLSGIRTLWYHTLTVAEIPSIAEIKSLLLKNPNSGISFEMHRVPLSLDTVIINLSSDDDRVINLQSQIKNETSMLARIVFWGNKQFVQSLGIYLKTRTNTDSNIKPLNNLTSYYLVYDPWALLDSFLDSSVYLNMLKYILTIDEFNGLFLNPVSQNHQDKGHERPSNSQPDNDNKQKTDSSDKVISEILPLLETVFKGALEQNIMPGIGDVQNQMTKLQEETEKSDLRFAECMEEIHRRFDENTSDIMRLSLKLDNVSELADWFDSLAQGEFDVSFSKDELKYMNVKDEEELSSKLNLEEDTIHLMQTAFSFARAGMSVDANKAAIMPFFFPLGALYEHMVRRYFKPAVFDHSPRKEELDKTQADLTKRKNTHIDLCEFDKTNYTQLAAYSKHAAIDGKLYETFYWLVWLNIFKSIRYIRNKAHTENGKGTSRELSILYRLMLYPGIAPKKDAIQYIYDLNSEGKKLNLYGKEIQNFLCEMEQNELWFQPSIISFILLCRKSEWKDSSK